MARAPRAADVVESIVVACSPEAAWAAVSDPRRYSTWSPETTLVATADEAPLPRGARFTGVNVNGRRRWSTRCVVVESIACESFAFDVSFWGMAVARWRYVVVGDGSSTRVEEQWWDRRGRAMHLISGWGTGVRDRTERNRAGMRATLAALRRELETR